MVAARSRCSICLTRLLRVDAAALTHSYVMLFSRPSPLETDWPGPLAGERGSYWRPDEDCGTGGKPTQVNLDKGGAIV
jgi:hypothetical protein